MRRSQLRIEGFTEAQVRSRLDAGRWQTVGPLVIVMYNGPLTLQQQRWAAVLHSGPRARLAGRTALAMGGFKGWECSAIHLLVPRGHAPVPLAALNLVIHQTRRSPETMPTTRTTSMERSAIDAASWSSEARTACGLLAAIVQQRLTTPPRLMAELKTAGRIAHRRAMSQALTDIAGGADSLSEIDFSRLCKRYELGRVLRQQVRFDGQGRRRYLDCVLVAADGVAVAFEVDGASHMSVQGYSKDLDRSNELLISGQPLLHFSSIAARTEPEKVADQLRRAQIAARVMASRGQSHAKP